MALRALATIWIAVFTLTVAAWASPGAEHDGWGAQFASLHGEPPELPFSEMPPLDSVVASPLALADITASDAVALPSAPAVTTSGEVAQPEGASNTIELAGPPAAVLMLLQGVLCVAFVRGRRKWALLAVAFISLGRTGLSALPRLLVSRLYTANRPEATQPVVPDGRGFTSQSRTPDFDFVGVLRQTGSDGEHQTDVRPGLPTIHQLVSQSPVAFSSRKATADLLPAAVLPAGETSSGHQPQCGSVLAEEEPAFPRLLLAFDLFARPPPLRSAPEYVVPARNV